MKKSKDGPFELPESLLSQLNEFTLGFCLSYIDIEGNPMIITKFDNQSFFLASQSSLLSWIRANQEMAKDCNIAEMCEGCEIDPEEED